MPLEHHFSPNASRVVLSYDGILGQQGFRVASFWSQNLSTNHDQHSRASTNKEKPKGKLQGSRNQFWCSNKLPEAQQNEQNS